MVRAANWGAVGDGTTNDAPALQKAIDAALSAGPGASVILESGKVYRLGPQPDNIAALRIGKATDLTLSGQGATLLVHPSNRPLAIFDSTRVTVQDLVIDYHPLPFTQARLTRVLAEEGLVRFRVEPGYANPAAAAAEVYRDFKSSDAVFLHGHNRKFTHSWGRLSRVTAHGTGEFEAGFHGQNQAARLRDLQPGDFMAIKLLFPDAPAQRDASKRYLTNSSANVYIAFSREVTLERITSYAAPGMTFVATGSEDVRLRTCRVMRKPGSDRLIAGNSDGAHLKSLTRMPRIESCLFEALMDDSVNIKISSEIVKEVQGRRLRLAHGDIATDDAVIAPGQSLSFTAGAGKRYLGDAAVVATERTGYREMWVELESPVAGLLPGDLAFLRPVSEAVISDCEFRSQLKTALLTRPPSAVSGCLFQDVAYGIHACFMDSIEGPPPGGLRVRGCSFERPSVAAIALHLPSPSAARPGNPALVAGDCRILMAPDRGMSLTAAHQQGIVLRNVLVTAPDGRTRDELFRLHNCSGCVTENLSVTAGKPSGGR